MLAAAFPSEAKIRPSNSFPSATADSTSRELLELLARYSVTMLLSKTATDESRGASSEMSSSGNLASWTPPMV